jgi:alpha-tubulin suppressor-like RCC1 family protein
LFAALFTSCINTQDQNVTEGPSLIEYPYPALKLRPDVAYVLVNRDIKVYGQGGDLKYKYYINTGDGSINETTGIYTAPATPQRVTLMVQDEYGMKAYSTVEVLPDLQINPQNSFVTIGENKLMSAVGGLPPYKFSIIGGNDASIVENTGLLTGSTTIGSAVVSVEDALGNISNTNIAFLEPLVIEPSSGLFPTDRDLELIRTGGEGALTYNFVQGAGIVTVDLATNTLTPVNGQNGRVVIDVVDEVGYSKRLTFDFFEKRLVSVGQRHACGIDKTMDLYCWGANDYGQSADTRYGPFIGDDPGEMEGNLEYVKGFEGYTILKVATPLHATCVLYQDGSSNKYVKCFGAKGETNVNFENTSRPLFYNGSAGSIDYDILSNYGSAKQYLGDLGYTTGNYRHWWEYNTDVRDIALHGIKNNSSYSHASYDIIDIKNTWAHDHANTTGGGFCAFYDGGRLSCTSSDITHLMNTDTYPNIMVSSEPKILHYDNGGVGCGISDNNSDGRGENIYCTSSSNAYNRLAINNGESKNPLNSTVDTVASVTTTDDGAADAGEPLMIGVGDYFACGLFAHSTPLENRIRCWGRNNYGQLGIGDTVDRTTAPYTDVSLPSNPVEVYAENETACAVLANGHMYCWGRNSNGNLGASMGSGGYSSTPVKVQFGWIQDTAGYRPTKVTMISSKTCALMVKSGSNSHLYCWGSNHYASLGAGFEPSKAPYRDTPRQVMLGGFFDVKDYDINLRHGCAIDQWGNLACWGGRNFGMLGAYTAAIQGDEFDEVGDKLNKVKLTTGRKVKEVVASASHTCTILGGAEDGSVLCFGSNANGRLGRGISSDNHIGDNHNENIDAQLTEFGGKKIIKLDSISAFNMAVDEDGGLWGWGDAWDNRIFGYAVSDQNVPYAMSFPRAVSDVATGFYHACVVDELGDVHCWGANRMDVDGNGSHDKNSSGAFFEGTLGYGHSYKWPLNSGDTIGGTETKVDLSSTNKAVSVSAGAAHTCALFDNNRIKCWGANNNGQLGIGDTDADADNVNDPIGDQSEEMGDNLLFVDIGTDGDNNPLKIRKVSVGYRHTCVLTMGGRIKCWGYNRFGQLGVNTTQDIGKIDGQMGNNLPYVELGSGVTAIDVVARANNTCAVLSNNDIKCWGNNTTGQIGVGDRLPAGHDPDRMGSSLPKVQFPSLAE